MPDCAWTAYVYKRDFSAFALHEKLESEIDTTGWKFIVSVKEESRFFAWKKNLKRLVKHFTWPGVVDAN